MSEKAQAWLVFGNRGRIRLGSPTDPERARATAQQVRATSPAGSSEFVLVEWIFPRAVTR